MWYEVIGNDSKYLRLGISKRKSNLDGWTKVCKI